MPPTTRTQIGHLPHRRPSKINNLILLINSNSQTTTTASSPSTPTPTSQTQSSPSKIHKHHKPHTLPLSKHKHKYKYVHKRSTSPSDSFTTTTTTTNTTTNSDKYTDLPTSIPEIILTPAPLMTEFPFSQTQPQSQPTRPISRESAARFVVENSPTSSSSSFPSTEEFERVGTEVETSRLLPVNDFTFGLEVEVGGEARDGGARRRRHMGKANGYLEVVYEEEGESMQELMLSR